MIYQAGISAPIPTEDRGCFDKCRSVLLTRGYAEVLDFRSVFRKAISGRLPLTTVLALPRLSCGFLRESPTIGMPTISRNTLVGLAKDLEWRF